MPRKKTTEEFINSALVAHNGKYSYGRTVYTNSNTKVLITCPTHGNFEQLPYDHTAGRGCRHCGNNAPYTTESFIEKAVKVHGSMYTYSNTNYINNKTKVSITCPVHGEFMQSPAAHIVSKQGCKECGHSKVSAGQVLTTEQFIEKAIKIHGDKYDYSLVDYNRHDIKVTIICKEHGKFEQKPSYHLGGSNCIECSTVLSKFQFNPIKETTLYYVYFPECDLYKIGITNRTVEERFYGSGLKVSILDTRVYPNGYLAWKHEQKIIKENIRCKYDGKPILYAGNSELFTLNIFPKGIK